MQTREVTERAQEGEMATKGPGEKEAKPIIEQEDDTMNENSMSFVVPQSPLAIRENEVLTLC